MWDHPGPGEELPSARPPRWRRRALPVAVCALLAGVLVFVIAGLHGGSGGTVRAADQEPRAPRDGAAAPGVRDNPLLTSRTVLAPVACDLPVFSGDLPRLRAYYHAEIRCLAAAWRPVLDSVGARFSPVTVSLADDPVTRCGALPPAAEATGLYCDLDRTIYLPYGRVLDSLGVTTEAHLATLAHEYGHHIQQLSGILGMANRELDAYAPGSPQDHELHRRVELQANCFAGLFLASAAGRGSISAADAEAAVQDFRNWVDSETHGDSETQLRWARAGFDGGTVATCDTWNAPSAEVR
ncbi:metalloprotease [Prauserella sp. PE36]|uniref:neutral zinc metallopeptidase n=1 Tax=Prauserella sp. PE36 TaxID=1504709 RepID=UPI000DD33F22|nr:neutral zinc metallopeptidase [Prauserella sp. PE36]RBM20149.1 metalloprotease [Prauserella sp. PE36]